MEVQSRDTLVVRLFNPDDMTATVKIAAREPIAQAFRTDFLENRLEELAVRGGSVELSLRPHCIGTVELAMSR